MDCSRQLITRLIDFIRPIYSTDPTKIRSLDGLSTDIAALLDKRSVDEKDKHEQLQAKIRHLRKSITTAPLEDDSRHSLMANLYRMSKASLLPRRSLVHRVRLDSIASFEQWADMEAETRKLHTLVQTQRNQIDTLVELLSEPSELVSSGSSPITTVRSRSVTNRRSPLVVLAGHGLGR